LSVEVVVVVAHMTPGPVAVVVLAQLEQEH
jgi:hypothetical protein